MCVITENWGGGAGEEEKVNMVQSKVMPCNELVYLMLCYLACHYLGQYKAEYIIVTDFIAPEGL